MQCPKCGSENVATQVVNEQSYKKGHGCLYTVLFGIFYWSWLALKWMFKLIIAMFYLLFAAWIMAIIARRKGQKFEHPTWYRKMMQRKGRLYNKQKSVIVCNNCGNHWDAK